MARSAVASEGTATMEQLTYDQLLTQVTRLRPAEQLRLLEDLAAALRRGVTVHRRQSVTALRGLGKDLWRGRDAQEYVNGERAAWDG